MTSSSAAWAKTIWNEIEEDDDSDTDSRLSGSVAVDSVMKMMQRQQHRNYVPGGRGGVNEFTLDPIVDQSIENIDSEEGHEFVLRQNGGISGNNRDHSISVPFPNGTGRGQSPQMRRAGSGGIMGSSPKGPPRSLGYANVRLGTRELGYQRRNDHLLSPVPENITGRPMNSSASDVGVVLSSSRGRSYGPGSGALLGNGALHRSMEMVGARNSPAHMGRLSEDGRHPIEGYHRSSPLSHSSGSSEGLSRSTSEHARLPTPTTVSRRSTIGSSPNPTSVPPSSYYHPPPLGPGRSPQLPSRYHHNLHDNNMGSHMHRNDALEHQVSGMGRSLPSQTSHEPNLNSVIDFLSSPNPSNVANAASYLQHLAYGDDSMKSKIRQFGGIPALIGQLRSHDNIQVQLAILGALRNLSYGRINVENKMQIASDAGLPEMTLLLKTTRHPDVRELITSVLWNLSSCDDIKFRILQVCLKDLVDCILVPHSGYSYNSLAAKDFSIRPDVYQWSGELRNTLGALRNISSAGEDARGFMRSCPQLVDSLVWVVRAATGQEETDEKTAENAMCILRNLSYRLESEVDPQAGAQDNLDPTWERQIQQEIEDSKEEEEDLPKGRSSHFLSLCSRPRTSDNLRRSIPRLAAPQNLVCPDQSLLPKRIHPVRGVSLLWQPEVVFPYLALLEKFTSTPELMEAAAGALQNLTACSWKWSAYTRHLVRKARGLTLLVDQLNHSHDTVVRSSATALRNLAVDYTNKMMIGQYGIQNILPRLPYGQNNLGISEQTTLALLCTLMELTIRNPDNARVFKESNGVGPLVRLTRSKEHTPRVVYAAHKLCSLLHELKPTRSSLKQEAWDMKEFQQLSAENNPQYEFERGGFANTEIRQSSRSTGDPDKENKKSKKKRSTSESSVGADPQQRERKGSHPTSTGSGSNTPSSLSHQSIAKTSVPPILADAQEPGYQMIDIGKQKAEPPKNQNPPPTIPSIQPIGMYAEIPNPSMLRASDALPPRSDSQTQSHSDSQTRSEPRSSPTEQQGLGSSLPDITSDDETNPGLAVYAQVDMEKKRASRKQKQQQNQYREEIFIGQSHPKQQTIQDDSWV